MPDFETSPVHLKEAIKRVKKPSVGRAVHTTRTNRRAMMGEPLEARLLMASTRWVTSLADSGPGSLRQAIERSTSGDTINAAGLIGTINLTRSLVIDKDLTLLGSGTSSLIINGQNSVRVFEQWSGTATVRDLTIRGGNAGTGVGGGWLVTNASATFDRVRFTDNVAIQGGGLHAISGNGRSRTINLLNSTIDGNTARWQSGLSSNDTYGGGIFVAAYSYPVRSTLNLNVSGSTITDNLATTLTPTRNSLLGGGIYASAGPALDNTYESGAVNVSIDNSTFTGNQSEANNTNSLEVGGAAMYVEAPSGGGMSLGRARLTLRHVTMTGNGIAITGATNTSVRGAGFGAAGSTVTWEVDNSIIFGNTGGPEITTARGPTMLTSTHNMFGSTASMFTNNVNNNRVGADPLLGTLGSNGGPTQTIPLIAGSLAINAASAAVATELDQRGYARVGTPDIGAVEYSGGPSDEPAWVTSKLREAEVDAEYSQIITAVDPNAGERLTFQIIAGPAWLDLTDNGDGTARLSGVPDMGDYGQTSVTLRVSDMSTSVDTTLNLDVSAPIAQFIEDTFVVYGTNAADEVRVWVRNGNIVRASRNGTAREAFVGNVLQVRIVGFGGNDNISATVRNVPVVVHGGDGDDTITTGDGADQVFGDAGADSIQTGIGNDLASGGDGADTIIAGAGADTVSGNAQNDVLYGGDGNDRINGNGGNDNIFGEADDDRLYGGDGNDTIDGGLRVDRLWGGNGNDLLMGRQSADKLYGEAGDDTLIGSIGADLFNGGTGNDSAEVEEEDYPPVSIEVRT